MQVEGQRGQSLLCLPATGARVRNAYRTSPILGNSLAKVFLLTLQFLNLCLPERFCDLSKNRRFRERKSRFQGQAR